MTVTHLVAFNSAADLRLLRKAAGMSQIDLAQASRFSVDAVKYWEAKTGRCDGHAPKAFRTAIEAKGLRVPNPGDPPYRLPPPPAPPKTCGARTRRGTSCACKPIPGARRCKFHGGLSTGPKTIEGRLRIAAAQRERHRARREVATAAQPVPLGELAAMVVPETALASLEAS